MGLQDLWWFKDIQVTTAWDVNNRYQLNIRVKRYDESIELHAFLEYGNGGTEGENMLDDEYWHIIWGKLVCLRSTNDWVHSTLSNHTQGRLALACLWDLIREIENIASVEEFKAISSRIVHLDVNLNGLDWNPFPN